MWFATRATTDYHFKNHMEIIKKVYIKLNIVMVIHFSYKIYLYQTIIVLIFDSSMSKLMNGLLLNQDHNGPGQPLEKYVNLMCL